METGYEYNSKFVLTWKGGAYFSQDKSAAAVDDFKMTDIFEVQ